MAQVWHVEGGMKTMASIAELLNAGLRFEADEAVAIAQQLIETLRRSDETSDVEQPYGPPAVANVFLKADGSIRCVGCGTTPAVSEIAIFLDTLLPAGSPRVPGGVRYAIARGMLDVDVAPFDSLEDFSQALARHEHGARDAIVRGVLARADRLCTALVGPAAFDRRVARTTALRRELRNADARLYQQQLLRTAAMMSAPRVRPVRPMRLQTAPAVAACFGAGLLLVIAGEFMHTHRWSAPPRVPVRVAAEPRMAAAVPPAAPALPVPAPLAALDMMVAQSIGETATPRAGSLSFRDADRPRMTGSADTARPVVLRSAVKRPLRPSPAVVHGVRAQHQQPGVMDRLRLGWLRDAFKRSL